MGFVKKDPPASRYQKKSKLDTRSYSRADRRELSLFDKESGDLHVICSIKNEDKLYRILDAVCEGFNKSALKDKYEAVHVLSKADVGVKFLTDPEYNKDPIKD